jgi:hypothetical protein
MGRELSKKSVMNVEKTAMIQKKECLMGKMQWKM